MEIIHYVGLAVAVFGWIWLLVAIFRKSVGWGIASLLLPFVALFAAIAHWEVAKKPLITWLVGVVIIFGNIMFLSPAA